MSRGFAAPGRQTASHCNVAICRLAFWVWYAPREPGAYRLQMSQDPNLRQSIETNSSWSGRGAGVVKALRSFRQPQNLEERCEFCRTKLSLPHRHLLEVANGRIVCSCDPCALRFQDVIGGRFKLIPRQIGCLPEFGLSDAEWESLALPINLAFFFRSALENKVKAFYPSPAGATESLLPLTAWNVLVEKNPRLATMQTDVEALLVNRVGATRDYFIVPIDSCFELVGLIRMHWHGLSGGDAVWEQVKNFFVRLHAAAE